MMEKQRFVVLDGWRGISILMVLAAHLLPLGPKVLQLNVAAGLFGMVLFFNLSGFLITHFLLHRTDVLDFLIRRLFRILPLVWLYMAFVLLVYPVFGPGSSPGSSLGSSLVSGETWLAHMLFYANYPPKPLIPATDHLWSICVEIHFYLGIALLVALLKKKGLMLLPFLGIGFTLLRVMNDMHFSVITHFRIDEILAGAILALIYNDKLGKGLREFFSQGSALLLLPLLVVTCLPDAGFLNYLRPYVAAALIGVTLFNPQSRLVPLLNTRFLVYVASISYALYVIHMFLMTSWLGSGEGLEKYAKRPLLFLTLFFAAHLSTFYYEKRWIALGRRISEKLRRQGGSYEFK
ncbi:MAG: acyltransferase [Betaproteobacteria bacterium HGW-Betaproteobacteria-1]|jgi:peptidoglycan/LPS O-acetylase OafA/YrhL|nr:MAG: acyltransferase [Betaproteobacteria bacterium HGW-Betaproteobacteria-1]